jgi:hypothetical protein
MSACKWITQIATGTLAGVVTGAIHYQVHPITEIDTFGHALAVAFSFWPGMLIGYLGIYIERVGGEEEPDVPAAAAICAFLWFAYLFRAITLLIGLPVLSDWTQGPVNWLVKFFELFV